MTCVQPRKFLFNDLDEKEAAKWEKVLELQPARMGWHNDLLWLGRCAKYLLAM
jgi:hypothetical protein